MAKKILLNEKLHLSDEEKMMLKSKMKQLTEASNLPEYMGELFLTEIKLSTDEANAHLRERARLLGLMK